MVLMRSSRLVGLVLVLLACDHPVAPQVNPPAALALPLPSSITVTGFRRIAAPPEYAVWWARLEACAGKTGDLAQVVFYVHPTEWAIAGPFGVAISDQPHHRAFLGIEAWPEQVIMARVLLQELIHSYDTGPYAVACKAELEGREVVVPRVPVWLD